MSDDQDLAAIAEAYLFVTRWILTSESADDPAWADLRRRRTLATQIIIESAKP